MELFDTADMRVVEALLLQEYSFHVSARLYNSLTQGVSSQVFSHSCRHLTATF